MAGLVRDLPATASSAARSRCAPPTTASTCRAIARAQGGGGHRRAAGFSTDHGLPDSCRVLRARGRPSSSEPRRRQRPASTSRRGSPRTTSSRESRRRLGRGVKVGHAGTLDPFATGLLLVLVGRATRVQRFVMALPKRYETVARLGWTSTTGDVDGEIAPGRMPPEPLRCRPAGCGSARRPTPRSRSAAGARTSWRGRGRRSSCRARGRGHALRAAVARGGPRRVRDRVLVGHLRPLAGRGPRRRLLPRAAAHGDRPLRGRRRRSDASSRSTTRSRFLPARGLERRRRAEGGPRRRGARTSPQARSGSSTRDGLIALAEPREHGMLKPVVGFRG